MSEQERNLQETSTAFHPTILVVASDRSKLKLLHLALTVHYACEVIGVHTACDVLTTATQLKPACVVMDVQPFERQALTLIDQLHALEGLEHMPILLTHSLDDFNGAQQKPHLILLRAPFTLEALYAAVNTCFGQMI